jgi:hypothetical protein
VKTAFWLFGQFEQALLDITQVSQVLGLKPQTIRNRMAAGTFPRYTCERKWSIEAIAAFIESNGSVPDHQKAA